MEDGKKTCSGLLGKGPVGNGSATPFPPPEECGGLDDATCTVPGEAACAAAGFSLPTKLADLRQRLRLNQEQVETLAHKFCDLQAVRARCEADRLDELGALATAFGENEFEPAEAEKINQQSADRLRTAVRRCLEGIHKVLEPQQRTRFALLIRTQVVRF